MRRARPSPSPPARTARGTSAGSARPTLVVHGLADPLVLPTGGIATARAVPGSKLVMYPDMGHDLPLPRWPDLVGRDRREHPQSRGEARPASGRGSPSRTWTTGPALVVLDVEGVLVPEIWIAVAERTGIDELRRTTRDEPDYDVLMRGRLDLLDRHGLTMSVDPGRIGELEPLPGAVEFLDDLRARTQVVLLSDTFAEFAGPLMAQLDRPTILCHDLRGRRRPHRRLPVADGRSEARSRRGVPMRSATASSPAATPTTTCRCCSPPTPGLLFHAPPNVRADHPELPAYDTYPDLTAALHTVLGC